MASAKQVVIQLLESLPDDCSLEDVQYELYVRQKVAEGERAADRGETVPHDEVMREARGKLRSHRRSLKELLEGVDDRRLHREIPTGKPIGNESW